MEIQSDTWHLTGIFSNRSIDWLEGRVDKDEDWIEHLHQVWKKQKERTWHIPNFDTQHEVQWKNVFAKNNPVISQGIEATDQL